MHDKASYMVNPRCQQLNLIFAGALAQAGMRSWLGEGRTDWVCGRLGDLYLHETAISHIRRLLTDRFVCLRVDETFQQFRRRMQAGAGGSPPHRVNGSCRHRATWQVLLRDSRDCRDCRDSRLARVSTLARILLARARECDWHCRVVCWAFAPKIIAPAMPAWGAPLSSPPQPRRSKTS